jgi:SsrA-binding protein
MPDKIIAKNKKAFHEYAFTERLEAGIALRGTEVKSLKASGGSITESFARFDRNGELFVHHMHIPPYEFGNRMNHDPERPKKLLMHKGELARLQRSQEVQGCVIVPLNVYVKKGIIKLEIGVGKGKKLYDKRESIKKRQAERQIHSSLKRHFS